MNALILLDNIYSSDSYNPQRHTNIKKLSDFCQAYCKMDPIQNEIKSKELTEYVDGWCGPKKRLFFAIITSQLSTDGHIKNIKKINEEEAENDETEPDQTSLDQLELELGMDDQQEDDQDDRSVLTSLFPNLPNIKKISKLWTLYWEIDRRLRSNRRHFSTRYVRLKTREFLKKFLKIYQQKEVTPYIHFFSLHLNEQYEKFGNLNYFSAQGLEKLNDLSTYQFFSSTNKKENFIKQMLEKDFRMALLEDSFKF
jgi:hypothetical protein